MKNKILDGILIFAILGSAYVAVNAAVRQTVTVAIPPNTAYKISFDAIEGDSFRLWCDGSILKNYTNAEITLGKATTKNADGTYTFTVSAPGLTAGSHSCLVSAFNTLGEVKSEPITVPIGNLPMKPTNIKIVVSGNGE